MPSSKGPETRARAVSILDLIPERASSNCMANTKNLSTEERKKTKRAMRKKRKAEKPLKARDYPRGSKKSKVKKAARGQAKR
jgi:hypothetical protein